MMQMQAAMGGPGGAGGLGGLGGGLNPFAPPGAGAGAGAGAGTEGQQAPTDPFPNLFAPQAAQQPSTGAGGATTGTGDRAGQAGAAPNPFAGLFGLPGAGAGAGAGGNPFGGFDPAMLFGGAGAGAGAGGLGGLGGGWGLPPRDTRPPEEIYATQLGQLNAMVSVASNSATPGDG